MTLVLKPEKGKRLRDQLLEILSKRAVVPAKKWDLYFGTEKTDIDPVKYQRELRDE